jgi:hypothetical protein
LESACGSQSSAPGPLWPARFCGCAARHPAAVPDPLPLAGLRPCRLGWRRSYGRTASNSLRSDAIAGYQPPGRPLSGPLRRSCAVWLVRNRAIPAREVGEKARRRRYADAYARARFRSLMTCRSRSAPSTGEPPPNPAGAVGEERPEGGHHPVPGLRRSRVVASMQKGPEVVPADACHLDVGPQILGQGRQGELVDPAGGHRQVPVDEEGVHRRTKAPRGGHEGGGRESSRVSCGNRPLRGRAGRRRLADGTPRPAPGSAKSSPSSARVRATSPSSHSFLEYGLTPVLPAFAANMRSRNMRFRQQTASRALLCSAPRKAPATRPGDTVFVQAARHARRGRRRSEPSRWRGQPTMRMARSSHGHRRSTSTSRAAAPRRRAPQA